jgi:hypothetical protein
MTTNSTITPELLDQLLDNYEKPEDLTGDEGLFKQLKKGKRPCDPTGQRGLRLGASAAAFIFVA